ncbi:hypothetical protein K2173_018261 [Erythroxylum novogranatense]|uniref:Uncharacterized protein n=1 Tax=Erythroxylum novogranatense TaxID=1862640 RepID=A0AAV8UDI6_9ROSI|nr:hypothetical protein K2173_018261 [Erythroxylum novogranatense]
MARIQNPIVVGLAFSQISFFQMWLGQTRHDFEDLIYHSLSGEKLEKVYEYNFDQPESFNTDLLLSCMEELKNGRAVSIPDYDFKTHKRTDHGLLHDARLCDLMNMRVFVDTGSFPIISWIYARFVKPDFKNSYRLQKVCRYNNPRIADNDVAIDLIVQHIRTKLGHHDSFLIPDRKFLMFLSIQIRGMHTLIRDVNTTKHDFVFYADRLILLVVEHGLGHLSLTKRQITTPTGFVCSSVVFCKRLCGVSIIRSEESMENALRACCKGIKIGKILIHREVFLQLIYEKLPVDISSWHVLLLDLVFASELSDETDIIVFRKACPKCNIIFRTFYTYATLNILIQVPQGIHVVRKKFSKLKIVTSEIDEILDKDARVIPGMGKMRYVGISYILVPYLSNYF